MVYHLNYPQAHAVCGQISFCQLSCVNNVCLIIWNVTILCILHVPYSKSQESKYLLVGI